MVILAFMQNMWVRDPIRVKRCIEQFGEGYRRRLIHYALFAGCLSGRRLQSAFGKEVCDQIKWEEASREITGYANAAPPADPAHIAAVLSQFNPDVVLCFGRIAGDAVPALYTGRMILAPHPAARGPDTLIKLRGAVTDLRAIIDAQKAAA